MHALMIAIESGDKEAVRRLVSEMDDLSMVEGDSKSQTKCWGFLHRVAVGSFKIPKEITEFLLMYGADPNQRDIDNNTPLHLAASNHNHQCMEALLAYGADPNAQGYRDNTPLHYAASQMGDKSTAELLIQAGANPLIENLYGMKASTVAAQSRKAEMVDYLRDNEVRYKEERMLEDRIAKPIPSQSSAQSRVRRL